MDWDKLHKAIKKRQEGLSSFEQIVGNDRDFWADFYDQNIDKMVELHECLLIDLRHKYPNLTVEDEGFVRLGFEAVKKVLKECSADSSVRKKLETTKAKEAKRKKDIKKLI